MKDFDKEVDETTLKLLEGDGGILNNKETLKGFVRLVLSSADAMDTVKKIVDSNSCDLSGLIEEVSEKLKTYRKALFYIKTKTGEKK